MLESQAWPSMGQTGAYSSCDNCVSLKNCEHLKTWSISFAQEQDPSCCDCTFWVLLFHTAVSQSILWTITRRRLNFNTISSLPQYQVASQFILHRRSRHDYAFSGWRLFLHSVAYYLPHYGSGCFVRLESRLDTFACQGAVAS